MTIARSGSTIRRHALSRAVALALGGSLLIGAAAMPAGDPAVVELSSLDGTNGLRLDGATAYDFSGLVVASAGDVNGDGIDDVIVGSYGSDPSGDYSGSSYVVFGTDAGFPATLALASLDGDNGFRIDGVAPGQNSGRTVAGGDINGDGFSDLVIGSPNANPAAGTFAGSTYIVFGHAGAFPATLAVDSLDGDSGVRIDGASAYDRSGYAVATGDINGDAIDDLLIGAYGSSANGPYSGSGFVVFGHSGSFTATIDLAALDGDNGFRIDALANDASGRPVALGDINGDGKVDVLMGATGSSINGASSGSTYVLFGAAGGFAPVVTLDSLDGSNGFRVDGVQAYDQSGIAVAAGDINGDGFDDLVIGAPFSAAGIPYSGVSFVVFGKATGFAASIDLASLDGSDGFSLNGVATYDNSGTRIASPGDVNGDGIDDLLIAAPGADPNASRSGSSYLVFGHGGAFDATFDLASLDGSNGIRYDGIAENDGVSAVAAAGDVNGDGVADLLIGAGNARSNAGNTYVVFGAASGPSDRVFCDGFDGSACSSH